MDGSGCAPGATVVHGTTCEIVPMAGFSCVSPGLCSDGAFAAEGKCTANGSGNKSGGGDDDTSLGLIAGVAVGAALLALCVVCLCVRRCRSGRKAPKNLEDHYVTSDDVSRRASLTASEVQAANLEAGITQGWKGTPKHWRESHTSR